MSCRSKRATDGASTSAIDVPEICESILPNPGEFGCEMAKMKKMDALGWSRVAPIVAMKYAI